MSTGCVEKRFFFFIADSYWLNGKSSSRKQRILLSLFPRSFSVLLIFRKLFVTKPCLTKSLVGELYLKQLLWEAFFLRKLFLQKIFQKVLFYSFFLQNLFSGNFCLKIFSQGTFARQFFPNDFFIMKLFSLPIRIDLMEKANEEKNRTFSLELFLEYLFGKFFPRRAFSRGDFSWVIFLGKLFSWELFLCELFLYELFRCELLSQGLLEKIFPSQAFFPRRFLKIFLIKLFPMIVSGNRRLPIEQKASVLKVETELKFMYYISELCSWKLLTKMLF